MVEKNDKFHSNASFSAGLTWNTVLIALLHLYGSFSLVV